ncbi:MAG: aminopeptidase [Phycisphaerales bacterium]|nr:MAG: aminopeptidase [Phycisphaerales bacterium]
MGTMAEGVRQAVENCLRVRAGEKAVIITDEQTREIGEALRAAVEAITGPVQFFVMEDFGPRPIDYPAVVEAALQAADVSIYAAQGTKGELQTFRRHMVKTVEASPKLRHAHMVGITPEIMCDGMCSDYVEIQRVSRLVHDRVKDAREIRVQTEKGCDFTAEFSPQLKWLISDGDIRPGKWENLPDGEVCTAPATVNGKAVFDGCLGDFFMERHTSLAEKPVTVEIRDGRAVRDSLTCENTELRDELATYIFETDANSSRVGEFAIGTNTGLTRLIGNLLQDEKFPGVHIAFGSPDPFHTGADWDSIAHLDGSMIAPTITVDGETLMEKGQFCFE